MNQNHLNWCRSHDWGQTAELNNGVITLQENEFREKETISFDSFEKLRTWAGY